jgi:hypothetical protein
MVSARTGRYIGVGMCREFDIQETGRLGDSHPHASVLLRHGDEHIVIVCNVVFGRIRQTHLR